MYFKNFANITEDFIKNNYPEYYNELFSFVKENNIKISERVYLFQNNMINKPKCINCDNNVNFIKFSIGYRNFCSKKCAALYTHKNPEIKEKRIKSLFVSNNNPDIRKNMTNKLINTISEYSEEKKLNIVDKRKSTVLNSAGFHLKECSHVTRVFGLGFPIVFVPTPIFAGVKMRPSVLYSNTPSCSFPRM
jgi:hypothetical protein